MLGTFPDDPAEDLRRLVLLVHRMRSAQAKYFQQRTVGWLTEAKALESKVDHEIARLVDRQVELTLSRGR